MDEVGTSLQSRPFSSSKTTGVEDSILMHRNCEFLVINNLIRKANFSGKTFAI